MHRGVTGSTVFSARVRKLFIKSVNECDDQMELVLHVDLVPAALKTNWKIAPQLFFLVSILDFDYPQLNEYASECD